MYLNPCLERSASFPDEWRQDPKIDEAALKEEEEQQKSIWAIYASMIESFNAALGRLQHQKEAHMARLDDLKKLVTLCQLKSTKALEEQNLKYQISQSTIRERYKKEGSKLKLKKKQLALAFTYSKESRELKAKSNQAIIELSETMAEQKAFQKAMDRLHEDHHAVYTCCIGRMHSLATTSGPACKVDVVSIIKMADLEQTA